MMKTLVRIIALVGTVIVGLAHASAGEGGEEAGNTLPTIKFELKNDTVWRPAGFWHLKESSNDEICQKLDAAFQQPWGALTPRSGGDRTSFDIRLMLGTEYSVKWTTLEHYLSKYMPAHRVQIDLNNDGQKEIIYRLAHTLGGPYVYELLWTDSYPKDETKITFERAQEIRGGKLKEPGWEKYEGHTVYLNEKSIHSTLPTPVSYIHLSLMDMSIIDGRSYILASEAYNRKKALNIIVLESRSERNHRLICHFVSSYQVDELF